MRPTPSTILSAVAAALFGLTGCQTPQSGGGGSGSPGTPAPTSIPTPTSAPQPEPPPPASSNSSSTSSTDGSAEPQSPQSERTASADNSGSAQPTGGQTPDERRAAIDRRLDTTLGTFDEQIRKEQERVAKERDAHDATAASTDGKDSDETKDDESKPGSADPENPPLAKADRKSGEPGKRPGDLKSDKDRVGGSNSGAASGSGATAQNIPDGSDDDIVARRLRKAAEQETDPELKEKLWKEYIEYKKNAGQ